MSSAAAEGAAGQAPPSPGVRITSPADAEALLGRELPPSDWVRVDQGLVDRFADVTGDHQWIHVDPERARRGRFGTTIAHGQLVFSLSPPLLRQIVDLSQVAVSIYYGADRVRFVSPLPVGERVRLRLRLQKVERLAPNAARVHWLETFEREHAEKPVCVAEIIMQYHFIEPVATHG